MRNHVDHQLPNRLRKRGIQHFIFCCLFLSGLSACHESLEPVIVPVRPPIMDDTLIENTIAEIIGDMQLPHEAKPSGVPDHFDWSSGPRLGYGNHPPEGWLAMITWGQVYKDEYPLSAFNTRVQLKNLQAWYLSASSNEWIEWSQTSEISGAYYLEDFAEDYNEPASIRKENEGISIQLKEGFNFHFWPTSGRVNIDPEDIKGVWISVQSRLILDRVNDVDDRKDANFLLSVGGDYWENRSAKWDYWTTNGDIGIGRFRYIDTKWRTYNMHTMQADSIRQNPPPF